MTPSEVREGCSEGSSAGCSTTDVSDRPSTPAAAFPTGHLASHPLPSGIVGALGLAGYQLLAEVAGVGAGRLGSHAFLLVAPDPDPAMPSPGTDAGQRECR